MFGIYFFLPYENSAVLFCFVFLHMINWATSILLQILIRMQDVFISPFRL